MKSDLYRVLEILQARILEIVARGGLPQQTKTDLLKMDGEINREKQKLRREPGRKRPFLTSLITRIIKTLWGVSNGDSP